MGEVSVSSRVANERDEEFLDFEQGSPMPRTGKRHTYIIVKRGAGYRIHEDGSESGSANRRQVVTGAIVRRYDPEAGDREGKPATFPTPEEASAYVKRWL